MDIDYDLLAEKVAKKLKVMKKKDEDTEDDEVEEDEDEGKGKKKKLGKKEKSMLGILISMKPKK